MDPKVKQCLEESVSIARMPPPTALRAKEAPTYEDLRIIRTPYVQRLCKAKEMMMSAASYLEEDNIAMCAAFAVQARRIPDSALICTPEDNMVCDRAVESILASGVPLDPGLDLLLQPPDPAAIISFYGSLHRQIPEDYTLATRAGCALMFDSLPGSSLEQAIQLFEQAFALLQHPDDDEDPQTLDYLSMIGRAHFQANNLSKAKPLLTRFVQVGTRDGHRKIPDAHFQLGLVALSGAMNGGATSKRKSFLVAVEHLKTGKAVAKTLPHFLQPIEASGPERVVSNLVQMMSVALDFPVDIPASSSESLGLPPQAQVLRGGAVIDGPRRHEKFRRESSRLLQVLKCARLPIAKMMMLTNSGRLFRWTTPAPLKKQSTQRKPQASLSPATIDELFSALWDQVYKAVLWNALSFPHHARQVHRTLCSLKTRCENRQSSRCTTRHQTWSTNLSLVV